jgi:hypothetical protein
MAFGMFTGYPIWDDNYFVLYQRESNLVDFFSQHVNRPLYGHILVAFAQVFGWRPGPHVVVAIGLWALLAWQTARLSRRLLPSEPATAWLAALFTLWPALATTQYTTIITVFDANLPVSLALAGLLLCLREEPEHERSRVFGAAALVAVGVMITEYALAAAFAAVALLAVRRRFREAAAIFSGVVVGYAVFWLTADLDFRPKQSPAVQVVRLLHEPHRAIARFLEGLWHCFIGAWAGTAGAVRFLPDSHSTLLALLVGLGAGVLFVLIYRLRSAGAPSDPSERVGWSLIAAVGAGILPIVLANRSVIVADPYETRYLVTVLPFAAIALALGVSRLVMPRFRPAAAGALAALAAYSILIGAFQARAFQKNMEALGERLRPMLRDPGYTIAVVPRAWRYEGSDLVPKVTWRWTDEEARRAWVLSEDSAAERFGPRSACHGTDRIDMPPVFLTTGRKGPVSHLVWVTGRGDQVSSIEPYCLGPDREAPVSASETPSPR